MDTISMNTLFVRKLFGDDDGSSSKTCPALPTPLDDADAVAGHFTLHQLLLLIAAISGAIATITSLLLFFLHAFNLRNQHEQIKIMRIITIIPVFSIIGVVNIGIGQASIYLEPWAEVYEAVCLCTFYLLVHSYISPDFSQQAEFFAKLPYKKSAKAKISAPDSLAFWRRTQLFAFSVILSSTFIAIVTDITQGANVYCINSNSPHYAHIWLSVLRSIFTGASVLAVIRLTYRLKPELPDRNVATQLWAFKLIIGLNVFQTLAFSIAAGRATPTSTLSYNDISIGLPNALLNLEMIGFSIFFHKAYSWRRYSAAAVAATASADGGKQQQQQQQQQRQQPVMNAVSAVVRALSPVEVFVALVQIYTGRWKVQNRPASPSNLELLHQGPSQQGRYSSQYDNDARQHWPQTNGPYAQVPEEYPVQSATYGGVPPAYAAYDREYERR